MLFRRFVSRFVYASLFTACTCAMISQPSSLSMKTVHAAAQVSPAKAECVMEMNSRRILYASHADTKLPMASTTKILTAATVLDCCDNLKEEISIPPEAAGIEGSSVYLKSGDMYSIEDLLYGLMLRSGNDCATALAIRFGGNVKGFAAQMNYIAQKAGALTSNFVNPHGLPCDEHYTTARDLSYITCYAMQNPIFRTIVATKYYTPRHWQNKNKMLRLYEGGMGVKTGYTKQAGRCLVSAAQKQNMTLVCTVLNCPTTYERSIQLLDDAFNAYEYTRIISSEQSFTLNDGKTTVAAVAKQDYAYPLLPEEKEWIEVHAFSHSNIKKKKSGEVVGKFEIYLANQLLFSGNLYKL